MPDEKPKIQGNLDKIDGQYVFGWAWDPENPEKRLEVVVYVDGEPVAEGVADLYREDLERAGIGDGRHGFRIELSNTFINNNAGKTKKFQLRVNEEILAEKEFEVSYIRPKIQGYLDGIDRQYVVGWAWDPENPEKRLEVVVYVDGEPVAEGVADLYREDLERAGIGDGRHGFRIELPKFFIKSNGGKLKQFQLKVGEALIVTKEFEVPRMKSYIEGYIDGIDGLHLLGWVWDRENPEERLEVVVYVDGKPEATGVADIYRQDLEKAGIGDGRHGFRIKLGTNIFDGNEHELSVKVINDNSLVEKPTLSKIIHLSNINDLIRDFKILSEDFFGLKYQETLNILEQIKSEKENIAEENQLLLEQLHQVQEELEKYYIKYQDTVAELEKEKEERERVITEREGRIKELELERDELSKGLTELKGELEKLHREKEEAVKAYEARIREQEEREALLLQRIEQLEAGIKEKAETINKLTGEVEQLKGALAEAEKEKAERERIITEREGRIRELEGQIHQLNQALAEANKKLNDIINLNNQLEKEKSNLESKLSEKNQKIQQLEGELIELQKCQEILDEELIKAEAQIELIKDVLLKEAKS